MEIPPVVQQLIERFDRNVEAYRSGVYNEAQVRQEFINPLFKALGWDMDNEQGYAEAYKDVIHEDSIKVGGGTRAPDYCFRIGGTRKFFLEAKKPSIDLKGDVSPAYQLRRYAWTAKLPLSILTDFEEFAVYDCRVRPVKTDGPAKSRVLYRTYTEYVDKWDEIASVFSREAILKGSFDKYAESTKRKRGTAEVDDVFLAEIEEWREMLARNLALRNPKLATRDLNFAVQRIIDRIIFLRICEDRGIEDYGRLMSLQNGTKTYQRLMRFCIEADQRYNSGLFHFREEKGRGSPADRLTPSLAVDDKVLKEVFKELYYPESPYEFSVLPVDILGQVYERFLGSVIRLTKGHRAVVEQKPEVRKAGGVYYTPTYIVDYIVKHTVGKLLEGKKPGPRGGASKLRILDPACGSGSFLLGAYQYLLNWHLDQYTEGNPERWTRGKTPALYQDRHGEWRLTTVERKRILLNNIYGVDIDPQAVEVTKLSLLLKVLEGESGETLERQRRLFHERALPDLADNIKCGNSLIGPDFYEGRQLDLFDEEEVYRINAFDWNAEFRQIMKSGGFDAVIGNPPYVRIQTMKESAPATVEFYRREYESASSGNYDIYVVFVEKGLGLLNEKGRLGFIVPHKFFSAKYGRGLREIVSRGKHLAHVVYFGDEQVFRGATTYTCLLFLDKTSQSACRYTVVSDLSLWCQEDHGTEGQIPADSVCGDEWSFVVGPGRGIVRKLSQVPTLLGEVAARIYQGPITSADSVFLFKSWRHSKTEGLREVYSKELSKWFSIESELLKTVVRSGSISRYDCKAEALVLFPYELEQTKARLYSEKELKTRFPLAFQYLSLNRFLLEAREKGRFKTSEWYRFGRTQNLGMWEQPKILLPYMITRLSAYLDRNDNYYFINVTTGGYGLITRKGVACLEYVCGLLNSRLLDFYLKRVSTTFHGGYFAANKQYVQRLPVRLIDCSDPAEKCRHDKMVSLVERMLDLHKRLQMTKPEHDRTVLKRQIDATDKEIDRLVYELYELTDEEIAIVEESTRG